MVIYEREYDGEEFTEDTIDDAVNEYIDDYEIEDAMYEMDAMELFNHLDEETRIKVIEKTKELILENYFIKKEVEDDA